MTSPSVGNSKYWIDGLPIPAVEQGAQPGGTKYWIDGLPVSYVNTTEGTVIPGYVKVWLGTVWGQKPAKVWTGSEWVQKPVKFWNGSSWVTA